MARRILVLIQDLMEVFIPEIILVKKGLLLVVREVYFLEVVFDVTNLVEILQLLEIRFLKVKIVGLIVF